MVVELFQTPLSVWCKASATRWVRWAVAHPTSIVAYSAYAAYSLFQKCSIYSSGLYELQTALSQDINLRFVFMTCTKFIYLCMDKHHMNLSWWILLTSLSGCEHEVLPQHDSYNTNDSELALHFTLIGLHFTTSFFLCRNWSRVLSETSHKPFTLLLVCLRREGISVSRQWSGPWYKNGIISVHTLATTSARFTCDDYTTPVYRYFTLKFHGGDFDVKFVVKLFQWLYCAHAHHCHVGSMYQAKLYLIFVTRLNMALAESPMCPRNLKITIGKQSLSYAHTSGSVTNHSSGKKDMVVDVIVLFKGTSIMLEVLHLEVLYLLCLDALWYGLLIFL